MELSSQGRSSPYLEHQPRPAVDELPAVVEGHDPLAVDAQVRGGPVVAVVEEDAVDAAAGDLHLHFDGAAGIGYRLGEQAAVPDRAAGGVHLVELLLADGVLAASERIVPVPACLNTSRSGEAIA